MDSIVLRYDMLSGENQIAKSAQELKFDWQIYLLERQIDTAKKNIKSSILVYKYYII